jgi:hypothetical protein
LWRAFERGDARPVSEYAHPDSECGPASAGGPRACTARRGPEHFRALAAAASSCTRAHAFEELDDTVLVNGRLRVERFGR